MSEETRRNILRTFQSRLDELVWHEPVNFEPSVLTYSTFIFNVFNVAPHHVKFKLSYVINEGVAPGQLLQVPIDNQLNLTGRPEIHARERELTAICQELGVSITATFLYALWK